MLTCKNLFERGHSAADDLIFSKEYPWQIIPLIEDFILEYGKTLPSDKYFSPKENVWIARSAAVSPSATVCAPCIIGEDTEVRQCAFIRGKALIGRRCVIGNSTELKNCIIADGAEVPHFNYVGDSILGHRSHMGAGAVTSNLKSDRSAVTVRIGGERIETGLKKMGAVLGDYAEIGCNSVLNPGSIIGKSTTVYPLSSVRGFVAPGSIFKSEKSIVPKSKEERY